MQSNTNKTKKTRKSADSSAPVSAESASPIADETLLARTKSATPAGSSVDVTSPVKKHRRATKTAAQIPAVSALDTETGSIVASLSNAETTQSLLQLAPSRSQNSVSHEEIAKRAYFFWEERGYTHGDQVEDWLRAESELTAR
jgi:hypothetical protein